MRSRQGILSKELRWPAARKTGAAAVQAEQGWGRLLALTGGWPRVIGAKSPKDEAIRLLRIAAEVEHSLMVQYLYAAFLLGPQADEKYRENFATIAQQEMGHLVTVQNLLRLLGASPHLDRDDLLPGSGKEPDTFVLEPVTPDSLAKYVVIESPFDEVIKAIPEDWPIYQRALKRIDATSLMQLNRVGVLYAAIYWLFMTTDEPEGPWPLDPNKVLSGQNRNLKGIHLKDDDFCPEQEISVFIANRNEWNVATDATYVEPTLDRKRAQEALFKISSQGEGVSSDPLRISHFKRFLALFAAAESQPPEIIKVPMMESRLIATDAGRNVAECLNTRYQILLLLIDLALRVPRRDDNARSNLSGLAIGEMITGINGLVNEMLSLTGGPTNGPVAPPFELPDGAWPNESLPNIAEGAKRLRGLLGQSRKLDETIRAAWPGLMDDQLALLRGLNASIEAAIGKL